MSEVVVHGILGSPFVRAVRATLEEKGQRYRVQAMKPGEHKSAAYLALHPFGRVPAIEHGGFRLYETQAILRYLDAVFPEPALQPKESRTAARMNQIMGINDWYLFPDARVIVFQRIVGPAIFGHTPDEAVIAQAAPKVPVCVGELDRLLGEGPFLAGENVSLADLLLAPQLDYLSRTPEGRSAMQGTGLEAWLGRMNARPSMQATLPPEELRRAA
ncbi:MAG TPA: glutathione S-transferase family protein [Alphaproteobacteria bacterium]|nr:glutathione S-transferase family protein [Alphaproteobacteria bacterium]